MGFCVGFYGELDIFPDNYNEVILAISAIMNRAIEQGATDFLFYDGTSFDRKIRSIKKDGIRKYLITQKDFKPTGVDCAFVANKDWLFKFADYAVIVDANKPNKQKIRVLWINSETLVEEWI